MRERLVDKDWISTVRRRGTEEAWQLVKKEVERPVDKFVPLRRLRNQNRSKWMSQEILRDKKKEENVEERKVQRGQNRIYSAREDYKKSQRG